MNTLAILLHRWPVGLFFLLGGLFCGFPADIHAQLHGTVTVIHESLLQKQKPEHSTDCEFTGSPGAFTMVDKLTVDLCMENGQMMIAPGIRTLQIVGSENSTYTCKKTKCLEWKDGHVVNVEKHEGHRWEIKEHYVFKFYRGREWSPSKQVSGVQFMPVLSENLNPEEMLKIFASPIPVKGRYLITVSGEDYVGKVGYVKTRHFDPCAHKTTEFTHTTEMIDPSKDPVHRVDNPHDPHQAVSKLPAGLWPIAATWEMDFDPQGCAGTRLIDRDENHTLSVTWNFRESDPCDRMKDAVENDLAYAEAYLDEETRNHGLNQYKCYVDRWVYERMVGRPPDPGMLDCEAAAEETTGEAQGVGDELGVNSDCELVGEEQYRKRAAGKCEPQGVVNGVITHEMRHVKQCREEPDRYNSDNPADWGDLEAEAHLAGVESMLESMKEHCPQSDIRPFQKQMDAIRAKLSTP